MEGSQLSSTDQALESRWGIVAQSQSPETTGVCFSTCNVRTYLWLQGGCRRSPDPTLTCCNCIARRSDLWPSAVTCFLFF